MKRALTILILLLAISTQAFEYRTVMVTTNGALQNPTNLWAVNAAGINAVVVHPESNIVISLPAILDGFTMTPISGSTTNYWWDFGRTNTGGQKLIYATLTATNDVNFIGATNCSQWSLISFAALASGGDRIIIMPTNGVIGFSTNGWTLAGSSYSRTLTNGSLLRMTIQSNSFGLEPQYSIKP